MAHAATGRGRSAPTPDHAGARSDDAAERDASETGEPRWLSDVEMQAWLRVLRLVMLLPGSLDRQLRRDARLNHSSYMILATLSEAPEHSMRMTELAGQTATSLSRLSHAVTALEQRGWVVRHPSEQDRRGLTASLTDAGRAVLRETAPGHVAQVRAMVLDPLDPDEITQLSALLGKIVDSLEADAPSPDRGGRTGTA